MKANGAPEKIYISYETDEDGYIYTEYMWHKHQFEGVENIEYTRTDAFIEKAWNWIEDNMLSSNQQDKSRFYYEQFINYMKGE